MYERPRPCWNVLSAFTPLFAFVCACLVIGVEDYFYHEHPAHYAKTGAYTLGVVLAFGFGFGCIALFRWERLWGITALGLALNAPFVLIVMAAPWDWGF